MFDLEELGEDLFAAVEEYVARSVGTATASIRAENEQLRAALAARPSLDQVNELIASALGAAKSALAASAPDLKRLVDEAVAALPPAKDGESVDPAQVKRLVAEAVAELPSAKDGESVDPAEVKRLVDEAVAVLPPAKDGESVDPAEVKRLVDEAVAALPRAKDGESVDPAEVKRLVDEAVAALPPAKDGKDVDPAALADAIAHAVRAEVQALPQAKDGVGVAGAVIDREGALILTLSDGKTCSLGRVVGEPGRPGFDLRHFDSELKDGGRLLLLKFEQDGHSETHEFQTGIPIYRGVFRAEAEAAYEAGDMVSFGGHIWHANAETRSKPDSGDGTWTMAMRKARDGKDGKGAPEPPQPIKLG